MGDEETSSITLFSHARFLYLWIDFRAKLCRLLLRQIAFPEFGHLY